MDLVKVTSDVYFYPAEGTAGPESPSVILLFGWMNAQIPHLRKFMEQYKLLFPNARQILIRCEGDVFWTREAVKLKDMEPIITLLQKEGQFEQSKPRILIHAFSNGGAHRLSLLSKLLAKDQHVASAAVGLIYDSLPGAKEPLSVSLTAYTISIRSSLVKYLTYIPLTLIWAIVRITQFVTRTPDTNDHSRVVLNTENFLPWVTSITPRLYLYSDSDMIVPASVVEAHITQAKQIGLNVKAEKFEGSGHVEHMRKHPERYWEAVKQLWSTAIPN